MVDMAHFAGLVAGGAHPSPFPHAHVVTTTTHKTLRGPRGGLILTNDEEIAKKINSAVFPGLQGGPLMHVIAAKAVAFGEALRPEFKLYAHDIVENAKALADTLASARLRHRLRRHRQPPHAGRSPAEAAHRQGRRKRRSGAPHSPATRTACRSIPEKPFVTSGIRLGTPACTTRGFGVAEFQRGRRADRRGARRGLAQSPKERQRRWSRRGQGAGARADRPLPDLPLTERRRHSCAVPIAATSTRR